MKVSIDEKLYSRISKALTKNQTIFNRVSKRLKAGAEAGKIYIDISLRQCRYDVAVYLAATLQTLTPSGGSGAEKRVKELKEAQRYLKGIFSSVPESKKNEAQAAYSETMQVIKDLISLYTVEIKQEVKYA